MRLLLFKLSLFLFLSFKSHAASANYCSAIIYLPSLLDYQISRDCLTNQFVSHRIIGHNPHNTNCQLGLNSDEEKTFILNVKKALLHILKNDNNLLSIKDFPIFYFPTETNHNSEFERVLLKEKTFSNSHNFLTPPPYDRTQGYVFSKNELCATLLENEELENQTPFHPNVLYSPDDIREICQGTPSNEAHTFQSTLSSHHESDYKNDMCPIHEITLHYDEFERCLQDSKQQEGDIGQNPQQNMPETLKAAVFDGIKYALMASVSDAIFEGSLGQVKKSLQKLSESEQQELRLYLKEILKGSSLKSFRGTLTKLGIHLEELEDMKNTGTILFMVSTLKFSREFIKHLIVSLGVKNLTQLLTSGLSHDVLLRYLNPAMLSGSFVGVLATVIFYGMTTTFGPDSYLGQLFLTSAKGAVEEALEHLGLDNNQKKAISSALKNSGKLYAKGNDNAYDYTSGILSAMVSAVTIPSIKYLANSLNSVGTLKLLLPASINPGALVYFGIAFAVVSHLGYKFYQSMPEEVSALEKENNQVLMSKNKDTQNIFLKCYEKVQQTYRNSTVPLDVFERHMKN